MKDYGFMPSGGKSAAERALYMMAKSILEAQGKKVDGRTIKAGDDACKEAQHVPGVRGFMTMGGKSAAGRALYAKTKAIMTAEENKVYSRVIKAWADACKEALNALRFRGFMPMGGKSVAGRAKYGMAKTIKTAQGKHVNGRFIKAGYDAGKAASGDHGLCGFHAQGGANPRRGGRGTRIREGGWR